MSNIRWTSSDRGDAARKLGIKVIKKSWPTGQPRTLDGEMDGFRVVVERKRGEDSETTRYLIEGITWPVGLTVRPRLIQRVWSRSFRSGDLDWDARFVVKTGSSDKARTYLTQDRRMALDD